MGEIGSRNGAAGAERGYAPRRAARAALPVSRDGKTFAALGAAPREHGSSTHGFHPGPKPVRVQPLAFARLVGPFHIWSRSLSLSSFSSKPMALAAMDAQVHGNG